MKGPPFFLKNARVAEAVPPCQEGLMRFYCSAAQQMKLHRDSWAWREGALDEALCRAGLWCASALSVSCLEGRVLRLAQGGEALCRAGT